MNKIFCVFCQTENAEEKNIVWFCEGPQPKLFKCASCNQRWYEWKELNSFTIILGAADYALLHQMLRPDTPLEVLGGMISADSSYLNHIRAFHGDESTETFKILEKWTKFNQARRIKG